mmetsp:Transcript_30150/g.60397  ORF Transcript_30150/g.60397 Transcript_30150/m.60397 type:complete len:108 (+) Transcript_30150:113-436(+)
MSFGPWDTLTALPQVHCRSHFLWQYLQHLDVFKVEGGGSYSSRYAWLESSFVSYFVLIDEYNHDALSIRKILRLAPSSSVMGDCQSFTTQCHNLHWNQVALRLQWRH